VSCAKTAEPIEMPSGYRLGWAQGSTGYLGCTLSPPGEYDWTVRVLRRCGLFVKLLWPLVSYLQVFCRLEFILLSFVTSNNVFDLQNVQLPERVRSGQRLLGRVASRVRSLDMRHCLYGVGRHMSAN